MDINALWDTVFYNLVMGLYFLIPLALCRLADIIFGGVIAYKSPTLVFNFGKLLKGVLTSLLIMAGVACLIGGVVTLPEIMEFYQIDVVDTTLLEEMVTIAMVILVLVGTTVTYGKDAFEKLKTLLKGEDYVEEAVDAKSIADAISEAVGGNVEK